MFINEPFGGIIAGPQGTVLAAVLRTATPLTGRQVHRLVSDRASQQTVQRCLHDLVKLGLLTVMRAGNANLYEVNETHVAIPSLRELVSPLNLLRRVIDEALADSPRGVVAVVLFGSAARGEATPDSDIDLAVIADGIWDDSQGLWDAVVQRYGGTCDILQYTPAEFIEWTAAGDEAVLQTIARDGITLWGETPTTTSSR